MIFDPDPITPIYQVYGYPYIDDSDSNISVLDPLRSEADMEVHFNGSEYELKNTYAKVVEAAYPVYPVIRSTTPNFDYSRSHYGFEQVNAYYHVLNFQKYLQSINYMIVQDTIKIDAQGYTQDNSSYNPSIKLLLFGEGGVDDAEDADVVVHEYGHAISYDVSPGTNVGEERRSLDEAVGDYFAVTYRKEYFGGFGSDKVFNWDGHNPFWPGRTINNPSNINYKNIPTFSNIHQYTTVFNAAMFEIWAYLGKTYTDKLMIEALYGYYQNMTYTQAAYAVLDADTALTGGGGNSYVIWQAFDHQGILNWSGIDENNQTQNKPYVLMNTAFTQFEGFKIDLEANRAELNIYAINGQLVSKMVLQEGENNINISNSNAGMFLLEIKTPSAIYSEKVIKLE